MVDWQAWVQQRNNGVDCQSWIQNWNDGISNELDAKDTKAMGLKSPKDLFAIYSREESAQKFPPALFDGRSVWPVRTGTGKAVLVDGDLAIDLPYDNTLTPIHVVDDSCTLGKSHESDQIAILWNAAALPFNNPKLGSFGEKHFSTLETLRQNCNPPLQWTIETLTVNGNPCPSGGQFELDFSVETPGEVILIEAKSPKKNQQKEIPVLQVIFPYLYYHRFSELKGIQKTIRCFALIFSNTNQPGQKQADLFEFSNQNGNHELLGWEAVNTHRYLMG